MKKESSFLIKFYLGLFVMYSILDLLSLVMEEGQQIKRKKLMQAVRKAYKITADSRCRSISVPLPKEIVHLTQDLFTSILRSINYNDLDNLTVIRIVIKVHFIKHRRWKRFLKSIFQNENISSKLVSFIICKNENQLDLSENLLPRRSIHK